MIRTGDKKLQNVQASIVKGAISLFGYSAINTARGALSSLGLLIDGVAAGCHPLVVRFLKGVYSLRPSQPRYSHTWDASVVLNYLINLSPLQSLYFERIVIEISYAYCFYICVTRSRFEVFEDIKYA